MPPTELLAPALPLAAEIEHELGPGTALSGLRRAIERLRADPARLAGALADLGADPAAAATVLRRSYWHANGFAKLVLHRGAGHSVRLHVWPRDRTRTADANPHGHRWEFASWVITGSLRETILVECGAGSGVPYHRCDWGRAADGTGHLRPADPVSLQEIGTRVRETGSAYACSRAVVHTVAPVGRGLIATVVVQGPPVAGSAPVYLRPDAPPENDQKELRDGELPQLLDDVVAALQ